jgi:hypothetical protein
LIRVKRSFTENSDFREASDIQDWLKVRQLVSPFSAAPLPLIQILLDAQLPPAL